MTLTETIVDADGFRDTVESVGTLVEDERGGYFAIVPSALFDDEQLPDVDLETVATRKADGSTTIPVPIYRGRALRGGVNILAREHLAAMWYDMDEAALEWELEHRRENDLAIPPLLKATADGRGETA